MSFTPAGKRNLKPSPSATASQQNPSLSMSVDLPSLQPAVPTGQSQEAPTTFAQPTTPGNSRKRKSVSMAQDHTATAATPAGATSASTTVAGGASAEAPTPEQRPKKSRTNTPWTPAEEQRLKQMRDAGNSWSEIAKTFPQRTEGSVKKHWYKDMHYAEFGEDEHAMLEAAIKEYDQNKWKVIGQKVGKPAKACEQYAKEHFGGKSRAT